MIKGYGKKNFKGGSVPFAEGFPLEGSLAKDCRDYKLI